MNVEEAFLRDIHDHPEEDSPRLIYADWLEEQGDPVSLARADFVRLEVALGRSAEKDRAYKEILDQLLVLRPRIDTDWLAALARIPIEHCHTLHFKFRCPKKWNHLQQTGNPRVRFCDSCEKTVHYCETIGEARAQAVMGRCVAVDCGVKRSEGDLVVRTEVQDMDVVGALELGGLELDPEQDTDQRPFWRRWFGW